VNILVIGGTRNVGHFLVLELLQADHTVTVFNRGLTPDELPPQVRRLHGDRSDAHAMNEALGRESFDAVVDMTLYNGRDAEAATEILDGRTGHYIFISTGQVYLVRSGVRRPFTENDYHGPLSDEPPAGSDDHLQWTYGAEKRAAEDRLQQAWETRRFPFTSFRLPMVDSERDHFHRIHGYYLRLRDGGPVLVPDGPHLQIRHVYAGDVVRAVVRVIHTGAGKGSCYNISQDETLSLPEFLELLGGLAGYDVQIAHVDRQLLQARGLLPACSPFSDLWMSELDNRRSREELGLAYTPLPTYLRRLIRYYRTLRTTPAGYLRRREELQLAGEM
jgi:nucleoside-diphosphate-sugar epimerase